MKYRTVIELICDAGDKDEASNIAGDYLKGDIDFGVEMRCATGSVWGHRVAKYAASSAITIMVFASFLLRVAPVAVENQGGGNYIVGFESTSTVMPELKTKHKEDFKQEWQEKKDDAVLEYLKN